MELFGSILLLYAAAVPTFWINRVRPGLDAWLAGLPALVSLGLLWRVAEPGQWGLEQVQSGHWVASLGVELAFRLNGISLLMGSLVLLIGALIMIYAAGYLRGSEKRGRCMGLLYLFMASMLGVVLADDLIVLFVFWELTSITSYLLIGYDHEKEDVRKKALQALVVTGLGGVAMMAGFILLGHAGDTFRISELVTRGDLVRGSALYTPMLLLVLLGAFTKSAQAPFHFWLPNAMAAPTPVSAYLHSATMVKAGVYLLLVLFPVLSGTQLWTAIVPITGAITFVLAGIIGLFQLDLKRILAFTTLAVLGLLTLLIGIGTEKAILSAIAFLLGHALYKATLFMTAGAVDHETGTRDVRILRGLRHAMPWTATAALLAALSKSGFPPFLGFIGKEAVYKTGTALDAWSWAILPLAVAGNMLLMALAFKAGIHPFFGKKKPTELPKHPHEAPWSMRLGPMILATLGLLAGVAPEWIEAPLVEGAAASVLLVQPDLQLQLWHGLNLPLLLSAVTLVGGYLLYRSRWWMWHWGERGALQTLWSEAVYTHCLNGILSFSRWQTRALQSGYLRNYLVIILATTLALLGWMLLRFGGLPTDIGIVPVRLHLVIVCGVMSAAAILAIVTDSRLTVLLALGTVGFGVALIFAHYSAPDLAITQLLVETLSVVLLALVIARLPAFRITAKRGRLWRDGIIAGVSAVVVSILVLKAKHVDLGNPIAATLAEWSYPEAKGRNIVNVILVDFRALDTMGEITVLAIAAVGAWVLLRKPGKDEKEESE